MLVLATVTYLTLFVTSGRASMCSDAEGMNDELRQVFLDEHNKYRSLVAKGLAKNKLGGYAPKAARMLKMTYDCDVEANTMQYVKKCVFEHDSREERNYWGQSIWSLGAVQYNKTASAIYAVLSWFEELQLFGVPDDLQFSMALLERHVGHYTQLAWQWSNKIGCAVYWCSDFTFAACEYNPAGNLLNSVIYEKGDPCTTDADCQCQGCVCSKDEALCIAPSEQSSATTPSSVVEGPPSIPADFYKAHCSLNNGMTDEARQMFLDKHNQYRSLVAKGQANNGQGGFAPKASRMSKMNYDCAAEASVMSWLTQCTLQPSPMSYRGLGLGENLWHADDKNIDKVKAANESTASWFGTLQSAGMFIGQDNTLGLNAYYLGAQYYAQMAWQKTLSLGCGVVPCSNMAIVGCHYKYAIMLGGTIYEMGDPCTTDADCKCIGCVCSKDEALCLVPPQTESQNSYWKN